METYHASYRMLSNNHLSRLSTYIVKTTGDQYNFRLLIKFSPPSSSRAEKWQFNETVYQLLIDFTKAYHSARKEVLYNILINTGVPKQIG
jgi:hypothetical protein